MRQASVCCSALLVLGATLVEPAPAAEPTRIDANGDALPAGAVARLGTLRYRAGYVPWVCLSADGKHLVSIAGSSGLFRFLDPTTGKEVRRSTIESAKNVWSWKALSPNGRLVVGAGPSSDPMLYDTTGAQALRLCDGASGDGTSAAFSADGKILAIGNGERGKPRTAAVWDVAGRKRICSWTLLHDAWGRLALSADGKLLVSWGGTDIKPFRFHEPSTRQYDGTLQLWEAATGKELRRIAFDSMEIADAVFSPDGKHLAVTGSAVLAIADVASGKEVQRWVVPQGTGLHGYSPDGKHLVTASGYGRVQVWEIATGRRLWQERGPGAWIASVGFPTPGKVLVCGVRNETVVLWEVPGGRVLTPTEGHTTSVRSLAFRAEGKTLVSGAKDGIRWWDLRTGKERRHLLLPDISNCNEPPEFLLCPAEKYLLTSGRLASHATVTDLATGREMFAVADCHSDPGSLVAAFSTDGTTVAVRTMHYDRAKDKREDAVRVLDVDSGLTKQQFKIDRADHSSLALSADGKRMALSWGRNNNPPENEIQVWDVAGGKSLCRVAREGWMGTLTFSPDDSLLATAIARQPVRVCQAATGTDWVALDEAIGVVQSNLAFSPDGRLLAAAIARERGTEPVVRVWELASGQVRREFKGHEEEIRAVAFAPDGLTLATGSDDTTVLLWDLSGRTGEAGDRLSPRERDALWSDLGGEAPKAHRALARLAEAPADAVALVRERLPPAASKVPEPRQLEGWIAGLDAESFEVREVATRALRQAGPAARTAIRKALEAKPSPEQKRRLEALLADLDCIGPSPQMLRPTRSLELLERIGTAEARRLLEYLAQGSAEADLTQQARAARDRLTRKAPPVP